MSAVKMKVLKDVPHYINVRDCLVPLSSSTIERWHDCPRMALCGLAAICTLSKIIKQNFHINDTIVWQSFGKYTQKTEIHFVTKAFFYLPTLFPIFA